MGDDSKLTPLQDVLARIAVLVGGAAILGMAGLVGSMFIGGIADHNTLLGISERVDAHSRRLDTLEQRPPRLSNVAEELRKDFDSLEADQRLCRESLIALRGDVSQVQKLQAELCNQIRQCDEVWNNSHSPGGVRR